jgi:hypothetical protein
VKIVDYKARFCSTEPMGSVTIGNACRDRGYTLFVKGQGESYLLILI